MHTDGGVNKLVKPRFGPPPSFDKGPRTNLKESQKRGLRFQRKVEKGLASAKELALRTGGYRTDELMAGPWVYYNDATDRERYSQPDILLFNHDERQLLILECKLAHSRYAWAQYKHYQCLLRLMYPEYTLCGIEVCNSYDPMECFSELVEFLQPHSHDFASYLWLD